MKPTEKKAPNKYVYNLISSSSSSQSLSQCNVPIPIPFSEFYQNWNKKKIKKSGQHFYASPKSGKCPLCHPFPRDKTCTKPEKRSPTTGLHYLKGNPTPKLPLYATDSILQPRGWRWVVLKNFTFFWFWSSSSMTKSKADPHGELRDNIAAVEVGVDRVLRWFVVQCSTVFGGDDTRKRAFF